MAATGQTTTSAMISVIAEKFVGPFESLRDTGKAFLAQVEKEDCGKVTYDWLLEDATYSAIWSAAESDQLKILDSTVLATDGVGTATAFIAPGSHPVLRPSVSMRYNYFGVQASGAAIAALTGKPNAYVDAWKYETKKAMEDFWRKMNIRALSSTTTVGNSGKDIDQIGILFNPTAGASYAGISTTTYPSWRPANDTTTTNLSVASMQTLINKIEGGTELLNDQVANDTIRDGQVQKIWTGPAQADNYFNLMSGFRRFAPDDTLDAGGADMNDTGLTFKGRKIFSFPRFPSGWMIMYSGGLLYATLQALGMDEKTNTVDSKLAVGKHYGNLLLRQRKTQGLFTALT